MRSFWLITILKIILGKSANLSKKNIPRKSEFFSTFLRSIDYEPMNIRPVPKTQSTICPITTIGRSPKQAVNMRLKSMMIICHCLKNSKKLELEFYKENMKRVFLLLDSIISKNEKEDSNWTCNIH